jgi:carbon monoxide dehydrogenase subunit G
VAALPGAGQAFETVRQQPGRLEQHGWHGRRRPSIREVKRPLLSLPERGFWPRQPRSNSCWKAQRRLDARSRFIRDLVVDGRHGLTPTLMVSTFIHTRLNPPPVVVRASMSEGGAWRRAIMASIRRELVVDVPPDEVWTSLRDVGNVAELFPGILTSSVLAAEDERVVTFANGLVVRERIVDVDETSRRIVYSAQGEGFTHHNASMQIIARTAQASRFIWITDFLPHDARSALEPLIDEGMRCFEQRWKLEARV